MHIRKKECSRPRCQAPPLLETSKALVNSTQFRSLLEKQFWKDEFKDLLKINLEKKFAEACGQLSSQQKLDLLLGSPNTRHRYFLKRKFSPDLKNQDRPPIEPKNPAKAKKKKKALARKLTVSVGKIGLKAIKHPNKKLKAKDRRRKTEDQIGRKRASKSRKELQLGSRVVKDSGVQYSTPKIGEIQSAAELLSRKQSKVKIKTSIAQHVKKNFSSNKGFGISCSTKASSQALLVHSRQRKWSRLSKSKEVKATPTQNKRRRGTPKQIASFWKTTSEGKLWKSYKKLPERPKEEVIEDNRQLLNLFRHNSQVIKKTPRENSIAFKRRRVTLAKMQTTEEDEKENFASENIDNSLREDLVAGKSFRKKVHDSRVKTLQNEATETPNSKPKPKSSVFSPMKSTFYQIIKNLPKARTSKQDQRRFLKQKISKYIKRQTLKPIKPKKTDPLQKNFVFENRVGSVQIEVSFDREKPENLKKKPNDSKKDEIFLFDRRGNLKNRSKLYCTAYNEVGDGGSKDRRSVSQSKREMEKRKKWGKMKKRFQSVEELLVRIKKKRRNNNENSQNAQNDPISTRHLDQITETPNLPQLAKPQRSWDKFIKPTQPFHYNSKLIQQLQRFQQGLNQVDETYMMIQRHKLNITTSTTPNTLPFDSKYKGNLNGNFNDMFDYRAMEFSNRVKDFFFNKNKGILKEIFNHLKEEMFLQRVKPMVMDLCFWTWVIVKDVFRESRKDKKRKKKRGIGRNKGKKNLNETNLDIASRNHSIVAEIDESKINEDESQNLLYPNSNPNHHPNPSLAEKLPTSSTLKPNFQSHKPTTTNTLDINIKVKPALDQSHSALNQSRSIIDQSRSLLSNSINQGVPSLYAKEQYTTQGTQNCRMSKRRRKSRSQIKFAPAPTHTQRNMEDSQKKHKNKAKHRKGRKSVYKGRSRVNKTCDVNTISRRNSRLDHPSKRRKRRKSIHPAKIKETNKNLEDSFSSSVDSRKPSKKVKFLSKMNFETEMGNTTETNIDSDRKNSRFGVYSLNISRDTSFSNLKKRSKGYKFKSVNFDVPIEICMDDKREVATGNLVLRGLGLCGDYIPDDLQKMKNELKKSEFTSITQNTLKQVIKTLFLDVFTKSNNSICNLMPFTSEEDLEELQTQIEKQKMKESLQQAHNPQAQQITPKTSNHLQAQIKFLQPNKSMELGIIEQISLRKNNSIRENQIIELTEQIVNGLGSHQMAENLKKRHRQSDFKLRRRGSCAPKRPINLLEARRKSILILNKLNKIKNRRLNELLNSGNTYQPYARLLNLEHGLSDFLQILLDYLSLQDPPLPSKRLNRFKGAVEEGDARLYCKDHFGVGLFTKFRFQSAEVRRKKKSENNMQKIYMLLHDRKFKEKLLNQSMSLWDGGRCFRDSKMLRKMGLNVHEGLGAVDLNDDRVIKVTSFKRKSHQFDFLKNNITQKKERIESLNLRKTDRIERLLALTSFLHLLQSSAHKKTLQAHSTFLNTQGTSQTQIRRDSVMHIQSFMKKHCPRPSVLYRVRASLKAKLKNFSMAFGAILGGRIKPEKRRLKKIARNRRHGMFLSEGFQKKHIQFQYWSLLKKGELNREISTIYENDNGKFNNASRFSFKHFGELQKGESFARLTAAVKDMRSAYNILTRSRFVLGLDSLGQIVYYKSHFRDQIDALLEEETLNNDKLTVGYYKMIKLDKSRTLEIQNEEHSIEIPLRKSKTTKLQNKAKIADGVFWKMDLEAEESKGKMRLEVMDAMLKKVYKDVAREKIFEFNFRQMQQEKE